MSTAIIVRAVATTDFNEWLPLWEGYNEFYKRVGPAAVPAEVTRMTWARFFASDDPTNALVAEREGRLLGLAHYLFHRHTAMLEPICYLQDLFTSAPARGQGVGRALINGVYERAKEAGATRVYWHTHETNLVAQRLYDRMAERSGFIVYRKNI
jgi:GNAT superfamily N-acetyltransferase